MIVVTGRSGTGKSTVADILHADFGMTRIGVGDALRHALARSGIIVERRWDIGPTFLRHHTVDEIFEAIREESDGKGTHLVIDGVRYAETCRQLTAWRDATIWMVHASPTAIERRLAARAESTSRHALSDAFEAELGPLSKLATSSLTNDGTPEDLRRAVHAAARDAGLSPQANAP